VGEQHILLEELNKMGKKTLQQVSFECGEKFNKDFRKNPWGASLKNTLIPISDMDINMFNIIKNRGKKYDGTYATLEEIFLSPFILSIKYTIIYPEIYSQIRSLLDNF